MFFFFKSIDYLRSRNYRVENARELEPKHFYAITDLEAVHILPIFARAIRVFGRLGPSAFPLIAPMAV